MPSLSYLKGGEEGAILDVQGNKSIGIIVIVCQACQYRWEEDIRANKLAQQFPDFTWSLEDCTDANGEPGAKIFKAQGYRECPECTENIFLGTQVHKNGSILFHIEGEAPTNEWWLI